jgi:hypothetical protein
MSNYRILMPTYIEDWRQKDGGDGGYNGGTFAFFTTTSQGTIDPGIVTNDASLVNWEWGDGDITFNDNSPIHTYTDSLPEHDVNVFGLSPTDISEIDIQYQDVIRVYLDPFINVELLRINNNENLTNLDVSKLTELQYLSSFRTAYSSIDISNNTELLYALIGQNRNITSVDVTNNTKLTLLTVSNSSLSEIDVSVNTLLNYLSIHDNNLNSIDVTNNIALNVLLIDKNNLNSIDVTNNINLKTLSIGTNNISSLDITNNPLLETLIADLNNLSTLDLTNNNNINLLELQNNQLPSNVLDAIITHLDNTNVINGYLDYSDNPGENNLTECTAYDNLIAKGWTIVGQPPNCNDSFPYTFDITFS